MKQLTMTEKKSHIRNPRRYRHTLTILLCALFLVSFTFSVSAAGNTFKLPKYEKFTLPNGLTVYLMEQHEVPLVYVSAVFPAGAMKDNGKHGLAYLTAETLLLGTKQYTRQQLQDQLDFLGVSYRTNATTEYTSLSLSYLNSDREKVFPILKEIIQSPSFDQKEFENRKKRLLMELDNARERPSSVIGSYYNKFLFGDHVYGNPVSGIKQSVGSLTVADVKAFYKNNYIPGESAIALVGDFDTAKMKQQISQLLRDWKSEGTPTQIKQAPLPSFTKSRVLLVDKEDSVETRFLIGGLGITYNNPDYVAVEVINTILGGRFTSWLNESLRINAGLTYGARSRFNKYKTSGTFYISSFTKTATTVDAIDLALKVMDRLHNQGIDQKTLDSAKNYIKGQFPPDYETPGSLAYLLTTMFLYDLDNSFIDQFQQKVDSLTVEKTKEIVKKYFPKDNLQFVLIGKAKEIKDKVKKYGQLTVKEIKTDGF